MLTAIVIGKIVSLLLGLFTTLVLFGRYFEAYCRNSRELEFTIAGANSFVPALCWTTFIALTYYV